MNLNINDKVYVISRKENGVVKSSVFDHSQNKVTMYRVRLESGKYITSVTSNLRKI